MICRTQTCEFPRFARDRFQAVRLSPPMIPENARMAIGVCFGGGNFAGEKIAEAEVARFGVASGEFRDRIEGGKFGDPAHRPGVVLITERGEEFFPEGLVPTALAGARFDLGSFAAKANKGSLVEEFLDHRRRKLLQRAGALALERGWNRNGFTDEPLLEFSQRGIEKVF